jgi:hypothetical protein
VVAKVVAKSATTTTLLPNPKNHGKAAWQPAKNSKSAFKSVD